MAPPPGPGPVGMPMTASLLSLFLRLSLASCVPLLPHWALSFSLPYEHFGTQ